MSIPGAWLPLTTPPLSPMEMLSMGSGALKRSDVRLAVFHADGQVKYVSHTSDAGQSFFSSPTLISLFSTLLFLSLWCHFFNAFFLALSAVH